MNSAISKFQKLFILSVFALLIVGLSWAFSAYIGQLDNEVSANFASNTEPSTVLGITSDNAPVLMYTTASWSKPSLVLKSQIEQETELQETNLQIIELSLEDQSAQNVANIYEMGSPGSIVILNESGDRVASFSSRSELDVNEVKKLLKMTR